MSAVLSPADQRKAERRDREESMAGLLELLTDDFLGPVAATAIDCVTERGADPRLMLLLLEKMQEGYFEPKRCFNNGKERP